MKVLHVIKSLDRGGAEVLLIETGRASPPGLIQEYAWFLSDSAAVVPELARIGRVTCLGARNTPSMALQVGALSRLIRRSGCDVVHAHLPISGAIARLAAAQAGVAVVYTEHNLFSGYHPATQLLARATWRLQRLVVAVSASVAESLPRAHDEPEVRVIPNAVPVERFVSAEMRRRSVRDALGVAADDVIVMVVAVFRTAKRLERVVELARHCRPGVRFVVVGAGPLFENITAAGADVPTERLQFLGARSDVAELLAAADIFLLTSDREGLPVAMLEAMAAALPVVVPAVGGIAEVVDDSVGTLVHVDDDADAALAFAAALSPLVSDPGRRRRLGQSGRERVRRSFGIERMVRDLTEVYEAAAHG
jgi:glycosyltransferase involved in cell wall biosynthesis